MADIEAFFHEWGALLMPVLVPGAHVLIASNPLVSHALADAMDSVGMERRGTIIRTVRTMRGGDRPKGAHDEYPEVSVIPKALYEPWLLFRKPLEGRIKDNLSKWGTGGLRRPDGDRPFEDLIASGRAPERERAVAPHWSLKPQTFLRQVVRGILPLGQGTVLDTFAGSGSTLAAAGALGYRAIGVESNPTVAEMAGSKPILQTWLEQARFRHSAESCGMRPTRIELATFGLKDRRSLDPVKGPLTTELRAPCCITLSA
jgi:DNA modification methylase